MILLLTLLLPRHLRLMMSIPSHWFLVRVYMLAALVLAVISWFLHRLSLPQVLPTLVHLIVSQVLMAVPVLMPQVTVLSLARLLLTVAMLAATVLRRGPHEHPLGHSPQPRPALVLGGDACSDCLAEGTA